MRSHLKALLARAIEKMAASEGFDRNTFPALLLEPPKQPEFGDLTTNFAMLLAKSVRKSPREIAETVLKNLEDPEGILERQEIAGPGFLNFKFAPRFFYHQLREFASGSGPDLDLGRGARVQVEFASVNPTGPLHVGHGRVAVIGDVLARLHEATGFRVEKEYYVNDAGRQMEALGLSLYARYRQLFGEEVDLPQDGYPGEYLKNLATEVRQFAGDKFLKQSPEAAIEFFRQFGGDSLLSLIRDQLGAFGIRFDSFFSEKALRERNEVAQVIDLLRERGLLYSHDGAQWFKSSQFGDVKDRALIKSDGELTYFASDIAYHRNKFERKFERLINVWGADHHGYVPRLKAAMQALGYRSESLQVVLVQMVQLTRGGEPVRMGKRSGEFVTLEEVVDEVGCDAARFFFLMRKSDSHLDFDLDLAKRQSSDNPVFYVQYAHARVASIFEQARRNGVVWKDCKPDAISVERLGSAEEIALMRDMVQFTDVLEESVRGLEPHRLLFFLVELAGRFHRYYNRHRIISEDRELTLARLLLVENVQRIVRCGLNILGVSAPIKMASRSDSNVLT